MARKTSETGKKNQQVAVVKLTVDQLEPLLLNAITILRAMENIWRELESTLEDSECASRYGELLGNFKWWKLYERTYLDFVFRAAVRMGMARTTAPTLASLAEARIERMADILPFSTSMNAVLAEAEFSPKNMKAGASYVVALYKNILSLVVFGESLNALVARAEEDPEAFMQAVQCDPAAAKCGTLVARLTKAERLKEVKFLRRYARALISPVQMQARQKPELDYALAILKSMRQLEHLSSSERFDLLQQRLRLHTPTSAFIDLETVVRYIKRWEKSKDKRGPLFVLDAPDP